MMTGRITMLGISRWTEKGCSYRTIQRFFSKNISWCSLNWAIAKTFLKKSASFLLQRCHNSNQVSKKTFGLGRFFSSMSRKTQRFKKQEQPQCCTQCRDDAGTDHAAKTFKADWRDAPTSLLCI